MSKIIWDGVGQRFYETGVSKGVLYPVDASGAYPLGVAWNGLTNVTESPEGGEPEGIYADNFKYLNLKSVEEFKATIECYTYPDEFKACDGSKELQAGVDIGQQERKSFGFAYVTQVGNDVDGDVHAYKIHLVYGALASPTSKAFSTINNSPEAITFSYDITTTAVPVADSKPTASLVIDSRTLDASDLILVENAIFGTASTEPSLPLPDAIIAILNP